TGGRSEIRARWDDLTDVRRRLASLLLGSSRGTRSEEAVRSLTERKEQQERELTTLLPALAEQEALDRLRPADLQARLADGPAFVDVLRYTHFEWDPERPGEAGERRTPSYVAFVLAAGRPVRRVELGPAEPIEAVLTAWRAAVADRRAGQDADRLRKLVWDP